MLQTEYNLLLALVRNQLTGDTFTIPKDLNIQAFLAACQEHKLEPFAFRALQGHPDFPPDALRILETAHDRAIFRDTQFDFLKASVSEALSRRGIDHVFLRGVCLKQDYPIPSMRTMSDMDILVRAKDLPAIRPLMEQIGGTFVESDGNHRTFWFSDVLAQVEFHPNLIHVSCPVATGVNPGWQYISKGQDGSEKHMTEEGFYLSTLSHLATHFAGGGVGIRFILDIWICRHRRKTQPDRSKLEQELRRIGLLEFACQVEALAEHWFSNTPADLEELEQYVLTSGSHGSQDRAMLNAVSLSGSRGSALWSKIFYPREELEARYDWACGRPWLLPAAWTVRSFQAVTCRGKLICQWHRGTASHSKQQAAQQRAMLKRFGIESKYKKS